MPESCSCHTWTCYGRYAMAHQVIGIHHPLCPLGDKKITSDELIDGLLARVNALETDLSRFAHLTPLTPCAVCNLASPERWTVNRRCPGCERAYLVREMAKESEEILQSLGAALGYPWFKDDPKNFPDAAEIHGVCTGDHVAASIAMEAAKAIDALKVRAEAGVELATHVATAEWARTFTCHTPEWLDGLRGRIEAVQGLAKGKTEANTDAG